jgi:ATP-dependent helicase/nuclease subunit B
MTSSRRSRRPRSVLTARDPDADAETVPSRWLNRLTNLLAACRIRAGGAALAAMRARGAEDWLALAAGWRCPRHAVPPATRALAPAASCGAAAQLSVTGIARLIRDPYAVYAAACPAAAPAGSADGRSPDAPLRGPSCTGSSKALSAGHDPTAEPADRSASPPTCWRETALADGARLWLARIDRVADWFIGKRPSGALGKPHLFENAAAPIPCLGLHHDGKADRIDLRPMAARSSDRLQDRHAAVGKAAGRSTSSCCSRPRWWNAAPFQGDWRRRGQPALSTSGWARARGGAGHRCADLPERVWDSSAA